MLTTLRIRNLALVADLTIEFPGGLIAITGETGAGKSILIGALDLVLGGRADRSLVRSGAENCVVEAVLEVAALPARFHALLEEHGLEPCTEGQLTLKRTVTLTGANRQFVNGSPTTLAVLAAIGDWLVDVHGPHDHQSLLEPARQLAMLDAYAGLDPHRETFSGLVRQRAALARDKATLITDERSYAQQLDLLRFQVEEITRANLHPDEAAELEREHHRSSNAARLLELGQAALGRLSEDETSLQTQAGAAGRLLNELQRLDPGAAPLVAQHEIMVGALEDLRRELGHYLDQIELDPERLRVLEERLNLLHTLERKYGSPLTAVIEFGRTAAERLRQLESRDAELERLNAELERVEAAIAKAGLVLSSLRRRASRPLAQAVSRELADLGFRQSLFDIAIGTTNPLETSLASPPVPAAPLPLTGFDSVEFQFAPNPGEPARPLRAIASSGELARVMLALKTVLAVQDDVPVLVFDEVDANVGGDTGRIVGEKLRQLATRRQVLCITHLAQVAAAADTQFLVSKEVNEGRTTSAMVQVEGPDRVTELARMLGGQSEPARRHAAALLAPATAPGQRR